MLSTSWRVVVSRMFRSVVSGCLLVMVLVSGTYRAGAQGRVRDVQGSVFGGTLKYSGEQMDD
ncbi:MAG: hypothetical protein ACKOE4_05860, partial [Candidatus Kapaibacterium sp.]